jgi:hypothetical protein
MFAEEEAREKEATGSLPMPQVQEQRAAEMRGVQQPVSLGSFGPSASSPASGSGDDEESIEQYMSKLLQRVRGESQLATTTQTPLDRATTSSGPLGYMPTNPLQMGSLRDSVVMGGGELAVASGGELGRRKTSVPAPPTDLEALRALANETARRAISRHALRKHRRNAVTKVIVSTLAGVTSLWMMLEAPNWLDLQFITACVSMLVAALWAGETFRTLVESFKVAEEEGPEEISEITAQLHAPTPIDLSNVGRWDGQEPKGESEELRVENQEPEASSVEA